jgi:antitoxin (DNA-binding transcriptional repressor) of toxin-antitoxin stability system
MVVGIRELKANLSRYLARVREGETLVITDRGKPVAKVERFQSAEPPASVKHLVDSGKLIWKGPIRYLPEPIQMLPGEKSLVDFVREQRR